MAQRTSILKGERIGLATMEEGDQSSFQSWLAENPQLRELIADSNIPTMEDQMRWFARSQLSDRFFVSLIALPEEELIGNVGLVDINPDTQTAEFRITIGNASYWGKGYGSEATQLFLQYAFEKMNLMTIRLRVIASNARALNMYEKLGFQRDGEQSGKTGQTEILMSISPVALT